MQTFGTVIQTVITRVFEDWAMMLVDPLDPDQVKRVTEDECIVVETDFHGVVDGRYLVFAPKDFLAQLATNVLGLDEPPSEECCEDAYREMGNVLSGNLLTEMFGEDTVFDILLPVVRPSQPEDLTQLEEDQRRTFCIEADGFPVAITFWAEDGKR